MIIIGVTKCCIGVKICDWGNKIGLLNYEQFKVGNLLGLFTISTFPNEHRVKPRQRRCGLLQIIIRAKRAELPVSVIRATVLTTKQSFRVGTRITHGCLLVTKKYSLLHSMHQNSLPIRSLFIIIHWS